MECAVTTSSNPNLDQMRTANDISINLNIPFIPRNEGLDQFFYKYGLSYLLVVENNRVVVLFSDGSKFFYHPNIAQLRLKRIELEEGDSLIRAMDLEKGDRVLDCTLGLGADALIVSYYLGSEGRVVGLEKNKIISYIVAHGFRTYKYMSEQVREAAGRVEVLNVDYSHYLSTIMEKQFDIIYFDPMFTVTVEQSKGIDGIRRLADKSILNKEILGKAHKLASKRVVVKARKNEMRQLGLEDLFNGSIGGKYGKIQYYYISCLD